MWCCFKSKDLNIHYNGFSVNYIYGNLVNILDSEWSIKEYYVEEISPYYNKWRAGQGCNLEFSKWYIAYELNEHEVLQIQEAIWNTTN